MSELYYVIPAEAMLYYRKIPLFVRLTYGQHSKSALEHAKLPILEGRTVVFSRGRVDVMREKSIKLRKQMHRDCLSIFLDDWHTAYDKNRG